MKNMSEERWSVPTAAAVMSSLLRTVERAGAIVNGRGSEFKGTQVPDRDRVGA